jgi:hypothetical protein
MLHLDNTLASVRCMGRPTLLEYAAIAHREGFKRTRKQRSISEEQQDLFVAVLRRMRDGASERRACADEGEARKLLTAKELASFRMEYYRAKKQMKKILTPGLCNSLCFPLPRKVLPRV